MIRVFGRRNSSNAAKVFWLLDEIGQDYELVPTGRGFAPTDTPKFLAMNPHGKVPVLQDGDAVVWESNTVLRYLASRFRAAGLWPDDLALRARVDGWMDWASISLAPPLTRLRKARAAGKVEDADLPAVIAAFALLDGQIGRTGAFIAGSALSLADITAAPSVHRWSLLAGDRPALPNLDTYAARLDAFPGYRRHIASLN
ncbi:glutathione S-transferase family protein [Paracoccus pacificus]|uniref:Glutathione S-transferase family protein n=1 Tax=Paracoccus pacificus TaxID=1463598 RepID=A0ABW4RC09_9RHOB